MSKINDLFEFGNHFEKIQIGPDSPDPTEQVRRSLVDEINDSPMARPSLEEIHGQVWNTDELQREFRVCGFMAPFVVVVRKSDNVTGTLLFQHHPRFYFSFKAD